VVDTRTNSLVENIVIQPFQRKVAGIAPEAMVLSKDGSHLYVACAGLNAVAVIAVAERGVDRVQGLIPTAWYPDHIALGPDGDHLAVATMLGLGAGWRGKKNEHQRYVHADRGQCTSFPFPIRSNSPASRHWWPRTIVSGCPATGGATRTACPRHATIAGSRRGGRSLHDRTRGVHRQGEPLVRSNVRRSGER